MRFAALFPVTALAAVAVAAPNGLKARNSDSECPTGPIDCCNETYSQGSSALNHLLGLLDIVLPVVDGLVGVGCTPVTVIGTGSGASCSQQPVCCSGNTFGSGLISVGCTPINVNA